MGAPEMVVIALIVMVLFGPQALKSLTKGAKELKKGLEDEED